MEMEWEEERERERQQQLAMQEQRKEAEREREAKRRQEEEHRLDKEKEEKQEAARSALGVSVEDEFDDEVEEQIGASSFTEDSPVHVRRVPVTQQINQHLLAASPDPLTDRSLDEGETSTMSVEQVTDETLSPDLSTMSVEQVMNLNCSTDLFDELKLLYRLV